ncbi:MAG: hypothetical protein QNJ81_14975 [Acidimicrobiia bacterium]|nr:hypothetical protein [Acidimicrobiia bacterium]
MSVGHIARDIEASGIPTTAVYVRSFRHVAEAMGVPRVVSPLHPMGRPMGPPGDSARQQDVLESALELLESATEGGARCDLEQPYRPVGAD